jgi:hypothetical protein
MDQRAIPVTARATPQKPPPRRGLRAVLAEAVPPGGPARYPFSPAWEDQSRVLAGAARARPPSPGSPGAWSPLPGSGAGRFTAAEGAASARNYPPRPSVNIPAACIFTSAAVPARGHRCQPRPSATNRASLTRRAQVVRRPVPHRPAAQARGARHINAHSGPKCSGDRAGPGWPWCSLPRPGLTVSPPSHAGQLSVMYFQRASSCPRHGDRGFQ